MGTSPGDGYPVAGGMRRPYIVALAWGSAVPIYEYRCETCGHKFDEIQRMDAPAPPCPKCGADVKKLVSAAAFVLKGGGWYKDHYGIKSGSTSGGEASSSEAKPASTPATPPTPAPSSTPTSGS